MLEAKQGIGKVVPCVKRIRVYDGRRLKERQRLGVFFFVIKRAPMSDEASVLIIAHAASPSVAARFSAQCSMPRYHMIQRLLRWRDKDVSMKTASAKRPFHDGGFRDRLARKEPMGE